MYDKAAVHRDPRVVGDVRFQTACSIFCYFAANSNNSGLRTRATASYAIGGRWRPDSRGPRPSAASVGFRRA